jgi:hypothetical protein
VEWRTKQEAALEAKLPLSAIHLCSNEVVKGPFQYSVIKTMWAEGKIPEDSEWWITGMKNWSPMQALPFIRASSPSVLYPLATPPSPDSLFRILVAGEASGPYTIGQVRSLWSQGKLTVTGQFKTQEESDWRRLEEIVPLIEKRANEDRKESSQQQDNISLAQLRALDVQRRMKSPVVAVIWAIFIPLLGASYGSLTASVTCTVLFICSAVFLTYVNAEFNQSAPLGTIFLVLAFFQAVSWVASMIGVDSYNKNLLDEERKRNSSRQ